MGRRTIRGMRPTTYRAVPVAALLAKVSGSRSSGVQAYQPGGTVPAVDYRRSLDALVPLRHLADRAFDEVDVLLAPTCMLPAVEVSEVDRDFQT